MARETIKSFVYKATRNGLSAEETWRKTQSEFPHRCVSWGYVKRLRKNIAEGDRIAEAFGNLLSQSRAQAHS